MSIKALSQLDFRGGINQLDPDYAIGVNEYVYGFNVRSRNNVVETIKAPVKELRAPAGRKQGLYGFDRYLLLFNQGSAYYKDTSLPLTSQVWTYIPNLGLSPTVSRIYAQAVPATLTSYVRVLKDDDVVSGTTENPAAEQSNELVISGIPAGVVCQDGINQPRFIYIEGGVPICRRIQSYLEWNSTNREYVPVGAQMAYMNGILFVASGSTLYRSVSGRPLDFVVNVDIDGNKGGDASTTAYATSFNDITCLAAMNSGELFVGTLDGCYPISLNYSSTIFGEPTFINNRAFSAGVVNHFSFVDLLDDYAFIDLDGIRSMNAISQLQNEGRVSLFSQRLGNIFVDILQTTDTCSAFIFDNYAYISVNTVYGNIVLVYDTVRKAWISFDSYGIGSIRQFAATKLNINPELYAITENYVYKLFSSDEYLQATFHPASVISDDTNVAIKLASFIAVFKDSASESEVNALELPNDSKGASITQRFLDLMLGIEYPVTYPAMFNASGFIDVKTFNFENLSRFGFKTTALLTWASEAKLCKWQIDVDMDKSAAHLEQRARSYVS